MLVTGDNNIMSQETEQKVEDYIRKRGTTKLNKWRNEMAKASNKKKKKLCKNIITVN